MFKHILKNAAAGALMMIVGATAANAATLEVNIYGASAQYRYWTNAAPLFLRAQGCAANDVYVSGSGSDGIAICAGAPGVAVAGSPIGTTLTGAGFSGNNNNYIMRYSSKNSIEGVRAVQNQNPENTDGGCSGNPGQRSLGNPATSTFIRWAGTVPTTGVVKACADVTIGASDVWAETFNQESRGQLNGPAGGGAVEKIAKNVTVGSGYTERHNLIIPFAFAAHTSTPFSNMSRSMAGLIYSGQVVSWADLGSASSADIIACLRHAGSGTHATLDAAVMRGDYTMMTDEVTGYVWFNDGSSQMRTCVDGRQNSIGYADADAAITANMKWMNYQGVAPTKANVVGGMYDFWSYQHLYYSTTEPASVGTLINNLVTWSSNAANMPATLGTYWAAESEMLVRKANDFTAPQWK